MIESVVKMLLLRRGRSDSRRGRQDIETGNPPWGNLGKIRCGLAHKSARAFTIAPEVVSLLSETKQADLGFSFVFARRKRRTSWSTADFKLRHILGGTGAIYRGQTREHPNISKLGCKQS